MDYIEIYKQKTKNSEKLFNNLKKIMPGGISHNLRYYEPYPIFIKNAYGPFIEDVDNNRYIDLWMGHYSHILGHNSEIIRETSFDTINHGTHYGTVNPFELELAEKIVKNVPSVEMLRFCTSGTEATTYATRVARAYTNKSIIIKVAGGWHGAGSELAKAVKYPYTNGVNGVFQKLTDCTKFIFFMWEIAFILLITLI
jgi:glutamate-1-semialdehyde 2,1-aminomutase